MLSSKQRGSIKLVGHVTLGSTYQKNYKNVGLAKHHVPNRKLNIITHNQSSNIFLVISARSGKALSKVLPCVPHGCCRQTYKDVITSLGKVLPLRVLEGGTFTTLNSDCEL